MDDYLFDPDAKPDDAVRSLEQRLAPLRFDPAARPLRVALMPRRRHWTRMALALAASIVLLVAGVGAWIWTWPTGQSWRVVSGPVASLPVGETVRVGPVQSLFVRVARIGWMRVDQGSVTLLATSSNQHRLAMTEGTVSMRVWAPPSTVVVLTPSGEVIDMGCEFLLNVEPARTRVQVQSGWVQLANGLGETLVPEGASAEMRINRQPAVPIFLSASPRLRGAVRELESGPRAAGAERLVEQIARFAQPSDMLTLLILARRGVGGWEVLVDRAAQLSPPSRPDIVQRARAGDREAFDQWTDELPLPPVKSWLRNWRDRLPGRRLR